MNLKGIRILVTRARTQASSFAQILKSYGAEVLLCPTIEICPPKSWAPLDKAIENIDSYNWLIFTSANGVVKFCERLDRKNVEKKLGVLKTCAIGPLTAKKMEEYSIHVDIVSQNYIAESILKDILVKPGERVLIPRAEIARDVLPKGLRKRGVVVDVVTAYRTQADRSKGKDLKIWLKKDSINCITFTSTSCVRNFFSLLTLAEKRNLIHNLKILAASIGPITSLTLEEFGWKPNIIAAKPTTKDLAEAILKRYGK